MYIFIYLFWIFMWTVRRETATAVVLSSTYCLNIPPPTLCWPQKKKKKYQNIKPPRMMLTWYTQPLLKKYGFSVLSPFFSFDWPPDCLSILIQLFFCFSSLCFLKLVCLMVETTSSWLPHFLSNIFAFISPHPQVVGGRNRKNGLKLLPPKRRRRRSVGWRMDFDSSIWRPIW